MRNTDFSSTPTIVRWGARILSLLIVVFWGFFIVAHLVGDEGQASRPLVRADFVLMIAMGAWLLGLVIAWKWEFVAGAIALTAVGAGAVINPSVLAFPGVMIPITATLFLLSWWLNSKSAVTNAMR